MDLTLLEAMREYLESPGAAPQPPPEVDEHELRLATAMLMVCMVRADLRSLQDEHRALAQAITRVMGLREDEAQRIIRAAEEKLAGDAPFHRFVALVDEGCSIPEKRRVLEGLWRIAYADAELEGHEEYLVRKIAERLHLRTADLLEAKVRAREGFIGDEL